MYSFTMYLIPLSSNVCCSRPSRVSGTGSLKPFSDDAVTINSRLVETKLCSLSGARRSFGSKKAHPSRRPPWSSKIVRDILRRPERLTVDCIPRPAIHLAPLWKLSRRGLERWSDDGESTPTPWGYLKSPNPRPKRQRTCHHHHYQVGNRHHL